MPYDIERWRRRYAERTDLTTYVTHLTRPAKGRVLDVVDVLLKILTDRCIYGSTTDSGFICGDVPAVCFQDVPLASLCQNVYYEQKHRRATPGTRLRYLGVGLMFPKPYAFGKGARPAVYDKTEEAKSYLPRDQWWRIVNFDLTDEGRVIDWSHEREWRCPGDFRFELEMATVLVTNSKAYKCLIERCDERGAPVYRSVPGVVVLENVLR